MWSSDLGGGGGGVGINKGGQERFKVEKKVMWRTGVWREKVGVGLSETYLALALRRGFLACKEV